MECKGVLFRPTNDNSRAPKNVDSHLGISGDNGGLKITVAKEGMIWTGNETPRYA
jgi:hypothetical protein